ncbi:MAG: class I SAM-dependent methyltransferase [bacterium]
MPKNIFYDTNQDELNRRITFEQNLWNSITKKRFGDESMLQITYPGYRERFNSTIENRYIYEFLGDVKGKKVLDCGCGSGVMSVVFALGGAEVTAFDISPGNIQIAQKRAECYGMLDRINFFFTAAEQLCFKDGTFDIAFGTSILHHTILNLSTEEIVRVMKPGGKAAFVEPLGTNPILNLARNYLPYTGKEPHGNDRPFTYGDIRLMKHHFRNFHFREFRILSMLYKFVGRREETFDERLKQEAVRVRLLRITDPVDTAITTALPFMRRFCQIVAVLGEK